MSRWLRFLEMEMDEDCLVDSVDPAAVCEEFDRLCKLCNWTLSAIHLLTTPAV